MAKHTGSFALLAIAGLLAAGCGGGSKRTPLDVADTSGKRGGDVTILSAGDVTSLDPGIWFYGYDYQALAHTTQRALYGWKPAAGTPTPDLAAAMPQTTAGGLTVTIKLKPDIRYSPPLGDRTVSSDDVKYAIERMFTAGVANLYASTYFGAIIGTQTFASSGAADIKGIETPDATTLVLKLRRASGVISSGQALSLPGTVPVPKDYAERYDKRSPSTYGAHQVFTGPYMIDNDGKGALTGYEPGKRLRLVRNPSWDPKTDDRPAYLDTMTFRGANDIDEASRRILAGSRLVSGDFASPPVNILRSALDTRRDQVASVSAQSVRYVALNTTVKPFDRELVRRAAAAALDRVALRATRGGAPLGTIATHFLPPGVPGFAGAGGRAGVADFLRKPDGDLALARSYLRRAGYRSGRYSGPRLRMIGDDRPPGSTTAQAVRRQLERLGFAFDYAELPRAESFQRGCGAAGARVAVCPNGAWSKELLDPQSLLQPVFDGEGPRQTGSINWSQVDDLELNASLEIAAAETDPEARAAAYAELDRTVTRRAYVIPWLWDNQISVLSADVKGVVNAFTSAWDMTYTSLR